MNAKKLGNLSVNDGHGLLDNEGLCDSVINDLNNMLKNLVSGQYIISCSIITQISQKIINLKSGIKAELDNKNAIIEQLKQELRNAGMDVKDHKPEEFIKKDGAE